MSAINEHTAKPTWPSQAGGGRSLPEGNDFSPVVQQQPQSQWSTRFVRYGAPYPACHRCCKAESHGGRVECFKHHLQQRALPVEQHSSTTFTSLVPAAQEDANSTSTTLCKHGLQTRKQISSTANCELCNTLMCWARQVQQCTNAQSQLFTTFNVDSQLCTTFNLQPASSQ